MLSLGCPIGARSGICYCLRVCITPCEYTWCTNMCSCQFDYGCGSLAYRAVCVTMRAAGLLGSCWTYVDRIRTEFIAKVSRRTIPPRDPDTSCRRHLQPPHFFHLALTSRKNEYSTRCSCDLQYQESREWPGW